jgi:hypothetical protein
VVQIGLQIAMQTVSPPHWSGSVVPASEMQAECKEKDFCSLQFTKDDSQYSIEKDEILSSK